MTVVRPARRWRGRLLPHLRPFYRRFPFSSPVSLRSADRRGCVDFELGIFYNRVPKAANSTVIVNLARERHGEDIPSRTAKRLFRRPAELARSEVQQIEDLFRFTFVRNPYTRLLSAYLDKVERKALMRGRASSFGEFVDYLERGGLYRNLHWAPQHALLLLPTERFEFIGRVEQLEADLAMVLERARGDIRKDPVRSALDNSTGASTRVAEYYTPDIRDRVRRLYARDFETFGYNPQLDL